MIETKDKAFFAPEELSQIEELKSKLQELAGDCIRPEDMERMHAQLSTHHQEESPRRDTTRLNHIINNLQPAIIGADELGGGRAGVFTRAP